MESIAFTTETTTTGHAFWGMDPSGYCTCVDCSAPDPNGGELG